MLGQWGVGLVEIRLKVGSKVGGGQQHVLIAVRIWGECGTPVIRVAGCKISVVIAQGCQLKDILFNERETNSKKKKSMRVKKNLEIVNKKK